MANDTSARPHELLNLKIKDIKFKITSDGIQYAELLVSGKTKPRTLPLFSSIPYIKDWLLNHPGDEQAQIKKYEDYFVIQQDDVYGFLNLDLENNGKSLVGDFHSNNFLI